MFFYLQTKVKPAVIPPPPASDSGKLLLFYFPLNRDVFSCFIRYYYV